jgi:magnesium transporter
MSKSQIYTYNKEEIVTDKVFDANKLKALDLTLKGKTNWLNFHGLDDLNFINDSFKKFNIHKLTQGDILDLSERPKIEEYDEYLFSTLKSIYWKNDGLISEQISFLLTENTVISYQEKKGDIFNEIRYRLSNDTGIVRKQSTDYLLYLLIDAVLEGYQQVLKHIQDQVDNIQIISRKGFDQTTFYQIDSGKEQLKFLKKSLTPLRDQLSRLVSSNNTLVNPKNIPYFNDIKDQILYMVDEIDSERTDLESLSNLYFASLSQRSNEVMQFLTIIAAIFIPLTFIVGVYGMNFDNIPELHTESGYFIVWGVMILITLGLIFYFRKKKWF